VTDKKK